MCSSSTSASAKRYGETSPKPAAQPGSRRRRERHQVHIVLALHDEDTLAGVAVEVPILQDVEQVTTLDLEDDVLEPEARSALSFAFFASSQAKYFTAHRRGTTCARKVHIGIDSSVRPAS